MYRIIIAASILVPGLSFAAFDINTTRTSTQTQPQTQQTTTDTTQLILSMWKALKEKSLNYQMILLRGMEKS